jgi:hypothetical protein
MLDELDFGINRYGFDIRKFIQNKENPILSLEDGKIFV